MKSLNNHPQIELLINGDETIMRTLYKNLFPKFVHYVKKNSGTYSDAEEIFHDGLFQLIARAKVKGIQITSTFDGYIFTVCKNLWLRELNNRKKVVRNDGVFELKAKEDTDLTSIILQERWELFEEMFQKLTENCGKLLKAYFEKVPYKEIVKRFSYANENTAFQRIFKCKKKLSELVRNDARFKNLYL